jgi:hypothetical protein
MPNNSKPAPVPKNARVRGVAPATQPPRWASPQYHGAIPGGSGERKHTAPAPPLLAGQKRHR